MMAGQRLEVPDDAIELAGIVLRQRRHDDPCAPLARLLDDVALATEPVECATNRRPADAKTLGEFALDHPAARREVPLDDQLAQLAKRPRDAVDVLGHSLAVSDAARTFRAVMRRGPFRSAGDKRLRLLAQVGKDVIRAAGALAGGAAPLPAAERLKPG